MTDRQWLDLRSITVTGRSTYGRGATSASADRTRDRTLDLLTQLERRVLAGNADPDLLEAIDLARSDFAES